MFVHRYSINKDFNINPSLFLVQCGFEDCAPGHGFGPVIRDHNLIHFIYAGKGYLEIFDNKVSLNAGQGFLIPTGVSTKYYADDSDPWEYGWFGYSGEYSNMIISYRGLSAFNNLFNFTSIGKTKKCIEEMVEYYGEHGNDFMAISKMFETFSYINPSFSVSYKQSKLINEIIKFIEEHFAENITVESLSEEFNLSRSQIFRYFKETIDMSPQQYLKQYRINHAANLLRTTNLSVENIKTACGFNDLCNFIRQFSSVYHRSPSAFRKYVLTHSAAYNMEHSPSDLSDDDIK